MSEDPPRGGCCLYDKPSNRLGDQRALVHQLMIAGVKNPVVFAQMYQHSSSDTNTFKAISPKEQLQLEAAADMGALMMDGLTDGLWLMNNGDIAQEDVEQTAFCHSSGRQTAHGED